MYIDSVLFYFSAVLSKSSKGIFGQLFYVYSSRSNRVCRSSTQKWSRWKHVGLMKTLARLQLAWPASSVWVIFLFLCVYNFQGAFLPLHMFIHFVHSLFSICPTLPGLPFFPTAHLGSGLSILPKRRRWTNTNFQSTSVTYGSRIYTSH